MPQKQNIEEFLANSFHVSFCRFCFLQQTLFVRACVQNQQEQKTNKNRKQTRTENKRHLDPMRWHPIIVERCARDDRLQGSNILRLVLYVHSGCETLSKVHLSN